MQPCELTATEAAGAMRAGRLTSEQLVASCLERIAQRDGDVRAFSLVDPGHALAQARARDRESPRGPLHGIPVAVKDMIDTCDLSTQYNSPIFAGHRPARDAACVGALRAQGAVILGKTDTHEFAAAGRLPATRNPHDLRCTAGGSSAGSGAAVAASMAPLALGTQTGGSTIRPAAFCGVFGMKPTFGEVSFEGAKPFSVSLDTIGWMARSVADLALLADALGVSREPWRRRDLVAGMRIGLCRTPMWDQAEPDSQQAVERAAAVLARAGAVVEEVILPPPFERMNEYHDIVMQGEGRAAFRDLYLAYPALLHDEFKAKVENRLGITTAMLRDAKDVIAASRPVFDGIARAYDAILTPSAPGEAPQRLDTTGMATFSRTWTAMHVPCIAIPFGRGRRGLPVGVQLVGPRYSDVALLGTAHAIAAELAGA
jgi:Asp-tRNA(Asn)/Glu-tRNA(Gln) amidotransferase A subunit family amidase